ncbi:MAG: hypothetical protein A3H98_06960 [Bacteroidetes bacterium RIFCSPLOWO2_02_FULL_36_8]|nr:MAG: hypothetical protein A3H98_06960 [Bacteroidetes bacterium RIFCSPLOWO2_02_FULL_36_8]OFY70436.1 MAG: hypothetical protein A3G23_09930 [Bacteroidetes bacterium RIFCSPLOWO2_12_FULL_37_12]
MKPNLQYISNEKGKPTAVVISIKEWLAFEKEYLKLLQYTKLKAGLKDAFIEMQEIKSGKRKAVTLSDFLNEH